MNQRHISLPYRLGAIALLWPLLLTVLGFSLLFGAIVLMRMRRIIADNRVAARLRRLADDEGI